MATNKSSSKSHQGKEATVASPSGTPSSGKLGELAKLIEASHETALGHVRSSLESARQIGNYLLEVKDLVAPGTWLDWVEKNCKFSKSQAQRYVRIANHFGRLARKTAEVEDLTMSAALRLLSPKKDKAGDPAHADPLIVIDSRSYGEWLDKANGVHFTPDSREGTFIEEKVASVAKQIVALARKRRMGDEVPPEAIALALVLQIKKRLDSMVVKVEEPETSEQKVAMNEVAAGAA